MTLRPAGTAATQTSIPLHSSATHAGVRVTVTDFQLVAAGTLTVHAQLVAPPAGLGLDGTQRFLLTVAFPPASNIGTLQRISVVVDAVSWVVSRDDPHLDLSQSANPNALKITLDNPVVTVRGPWVISLPLPKT